MKDWKGAFWTVQYWMDQAARAVGEILRTALSLSVVTGKPFFIEKIRRLGGPSRPGLLRQHLAAVLAAAEIGDARDGRRLCRFNTGSVSNAVRDQAGQVQLAVGHAGSGNTGVAQPSCLRAVTAI